MSGYIGNIPVPQATESRVKIVATEGQTSFPTLGYTPNYLDVYLNGIHLANGTDFVATNSSDVVFNDPTTAGDVVVIVSHETFSLLDSSSVDAGFLGGQTGSYYTGYTDTAVANIVIDKATIDALNVNSDTLDGQHGAYYTGYTDTAITNLVDTAPGTLDTLNELAAALGDDPNFATTVTNNIATKLPLAGGTLTGNLDVNGTAKSTAVTTTNSGITLQSGSVTKSAINIAASTNQGINGTIAGDQYNWTTGGKMLWSTNNGTNAHLVLDASGNVGIGTTSPSRNLTVSSSTQTDLAIIAASGSSSQLCFGDGDDDNVGQIEYSHPTDSMRLYTQGTERMRIDASGNVGIGVSPNAIADLHVADTSDARIWLDATSADTMELYSGIGVGMFNRSNSHLMLGTNNTERMRIDASGNLLVGMSSSSGTADGLRVVPDDFMSFTNNRSDANDRLVILNRQASDGTHIEFRKANTTVGYVGTYGGDLTVGTGDTGVRFIDSLDTIVPISDSAGTSRDAAIDLGYSSIRFKDAHFSGTVNATSFSGDGSNLTGVGGGASVQEFTSSGTWNKPSSGTVAMITCIGGGGGGAKNNANIGNTYSVGGSMQVKWVLLSDLPSSVTVTIGAGGALGYQSAAGAGGHTTFGTEALGSGGQGAETYWSGFFNINYPSGTPYNANIHDGFLSGNQQPIRRAGDGTIRPQVQGNGSASNINLSIVSGQTGVSSPYSYFMSQGAGGFAPHGGSTQTAQVGYGSGGVVVAESSAAGTAGNSGYVSVVVF